VYRGGMVKAIPPNLKGCKESSKEEGESRLSNIFTFFDRLVDVLCKMLLLVQVIVVSIVVFGRVLFKVTPSWGEQISLVAMVWFGLLSASIAVRDNSHICVTLLEKVLPPVWLQWNDRINAVLMFLFSTFMVIVGIQLTKLTALNILTGLNIPSSWLYASVPAAGLAIMVQLFRGKKEVN
jgi:TRAP-type C4-dicarboxylate transport system permease small subunit